MLKKECTVEISRLAIKFELKTGIVIRWKRIK